MKELLYGKTRTYLVGDVLLVDTDWAGTLPSLFRKLKESDIPTESIRYLMITHYHPDHMGIADEKIQNSYKNILSRGVSRLRYGHMVSERIDRE